MLLSACGPLWGGIDQPSESFVNPEGSIPSLTPFQPEGYTPPPAPTNTLPVNVPTYTTIPPSLWISPAVPAALSQSALQSGVPLAASPELASIRLDALDPKSSIVNPVTSTWIYALVAPFPTITDGVMLADIQSSWNGTPSGPFSGRPLWMDETTEAAFISLWGLPAVGTVSIATADSLLDSTWADQPAWAIIPFESIQPRWKVLRVDGQSPIHNDFDAQTYPLKVGFSLQPDSFSLPAINRDPSKLTVLAMTGVTALVRATADRMETHGILYPGEEVRSVLRSADLTHVSNEVSFDPNCPIPNPYTESLSFCSSPAYIALLEDVGVDIVELTGNHLLDYGQSDFLNTLDMYAQRNWSHFGGGRDLAEALKPLTLTDHGNKLAFIGCNYAGPPNDWATETSPGSAPCDFEQMQAEITDLRFQGYLPVVTFQYDEYYQSFPTDYEMADFRSMADAGAVVVSGSQAHMPASMEFDGSSFIHYGLGNLFFDQMSHLMPDGSVIYDTRNVFIDRHVFYEGKYVGTELLTYIIEDYARPRLMSEAERTHFLRSIFSAGGW